MRVTDKDDNKVIEDWGRFTSKYNFERHRLKAPAVKEIDGYNIFFTWYFDGMPYTEHKDYWEAIERTGEIKGDFPKIIWKNGAKEWRGSFLGVLHRFFEPAVIYPNGDKEWWYNGMRHRVGGPAVIIGNKQYWFNRGEFIKETTK